MDKKIILGKEITTDENAALEIKELAKHFGCFGTIGSGKTVTCKVMIEELAMQGIPGIIIDPKGDLSSMAQLASPEELSNFGVDPAILEKFRENVEVVIWTPGSEKGIPLSISPLKFDDVDPLSEDEKRTYYNDVAITMLSLMNYDIESDGAKSSVIVLSELFNYCISNGKPIHDVDHIIEHLVKLPKEISKEISHISNAEKINKLILRLRLLKKGANNQLFNVGYPLDIDMLLGTGQDNGKTRLSIVYLNTITNHSGKEFFISLLAQKLYHWAKKNPKDKDQPLKCSFFIDEVHPFLPPVKKPICKEYLLRCVKEFRGYGISCILATQNIAGVDYHAFGNIGTSNFGKFNARQDIDKIRHILESRKDNIIMNVVSMVPSMKTGEFLLVSSTGEDLMHYKVRGLVTSHYILTVDDVSKLTTREIRKMIKEEAGTRSESPDPVEKPTNDEGTEDPEIAEETESAVAEKPGKKESASDNKKDAVKTPPKENGDLLHVVKQNIYGKDIPKILKSKLKSVFTVKKEITDYSKLYYPLARASFTFKKRKGFFGKNYENITESIYIEIMSGKFQIMHCNRGRFEFEFIIASDPDEIKDLDGICIIEPKPHSDVEIDITQYKKRFSKTKIKSVVESNYDVKTHDIDLVLFPFWRCELTDVETRETEIVEIDAVLGRPFSIKVLKS